MTDRAPVLVLSGHLAAMGAVRCFGVAGVPVVNLHYADSDFAQTSRHVRHRVRCPHPERDEQGFIDAIVDCRRRFGRCLIVPGNDATLVVASRRKRELEAHHVVAAADWSVIEKVIDKKHTYALAHAHGVPAPRTENPETRDDLERIGATFLFPCLVKPRESHRYAEIFRAKVARVHDRAQLAVEFDRAMSAGIQVMVQEYIPGDDSHSFNYNSYRMPGNTIDFTAQKLRLAPPEFGLPRVVVSREVPELRAPAQRILDVLGYQGYSCTEFKLDSRDRVFKLMEVNGRVNRSILHPLGCGINFPWLMYRHLMLGETITAPEQTRDPVYWIDLSSDLRYSILGWKREGHGLDGYLRPYFGRKIFAVGDGMDVMPVLKRSLETVETRFRQLAKALRLTRPAP